MRESAQFLGGWAAATFRVGEFRGVESLCEGDKLIRVGEQCLTGALSVVCPLTFLFSVQFSATFPGLLPVSRPKPLPDLKTEQGRVWLSINRGARKGQIHHPNIFSWKVSDQLASMGIFS
jgi:hypothetical protein